MNATADLDLVTTSESSRAHRDIVVVGASAGGVQALSRFVAGFPASFPGVVIVVQHLPAGAPTLLPAILSRAGALPAMPAEEGAPIQPGHIYVASPDLHHLTIEPGTMHLVFGPRENSVRPAADVLFRSAAHAYGRRVVGVILSGTGVDGTEGLKAIKAAGGLAMIQNPTEAGFAGMPRYAARFDDVDYVVPVGEMGTLLTELAKGMCDVDADDDPPPNFAPDRDVRATRALIASLEERQLLLRQMATEGLPASVAALTKRADDIVSEVEALKTALPRVLEVPDLDTSPPADEEVRY
jgi:two-component system, chemotaxis family, protein-glutamate methylesterase/glutaminase